jgi:predicted amidohydrolase
MKLALLQFDIAWNDPKENESRCARLVSDAVDQGAEVIVFPEMFTSGFSLLSGNDAVVAGSIGTSFLAHVASEYGVHTIGSVPEITESGDMFNTAWVFNSSGKVASYRKIHLFSYGNETDLYRPGDSLLTIALPGGIRCTLFICYDLRFSVPFYKAARKTDLFLILANWPSARREHWLTLLRARAIENQAFVAGVNRIGSGGGLEYSGDSSVYAPDGSVIGAMHDRSGVLVSEIESSTVSETRNTFPALADRQDSVYNSFPYED